ncbi:Gcd10p family-domain-containing protein [Phakopsora pachyrhizi]|uniref:tRNA (adenine(58)-N(1))-methyltransferase non-catalytic subunit TRM6 n=1 Tax=Phakopsora pachyrhizi TaxID=170000 RepID=A0AAV0AE73_PHAPC|nr:Gcd10p family-domain-containing protein [Phakopsora pachyrhizi]
MDDLTKAEDKGFDHLTVEKSKASFQDEAGEISSGKAQFDQSNINYDYDEGEEAEDGENDIGERRISINDNLLLKLPSGQIKQISNLSADSPISLGKYGKFNSNEIIGDPFGLTYEIVFKSSDQPNKKDPSTLEGTLVRLSSSSNSINNDDLNRGDDFYSSNDHKILNVEEIEATNENIKESVGAQKMSYDDIEELKKSGLSGREIIQRQIQQHSAFELKSEFSKAKYIKRKEKKFLKSFTCLDPTIYNVNQYLFENYFYSIKGLRTDTLSQILNLSNVRPGWRGIVLDQVGGLLIGAVITRMAGEGEVYVINDSDSPPDLHFLDHLNLNSSKRNKSNLKVLKSLNWLQICASKTTTMSTSCCSSKSKNIFKTLDSSDLVTSLEDQNLTELNILKSKLLLLESNEKQNNLTDNNCCSRSVDLNGNSTSNGNKRLEREKLKIRKKINKLSKLLSIKENFLNSKFEGLISCSDFEPFSIVRNLSRFLSFSSSITIYSQYLIQLSELQSFFKQKQQFNKTSSNKMDEDDESVKISDKNHMINSEDCTFINVTISEPWLRKYQVLPGRTHPEMNGTHSGGFILTAIKVSS